MDVCVWSHDGDICLPRTMQAAPAPFLQAVAPYRDDLVVAVEGLFPWYGLADLWAKEDSTFVLGPALSMKAIHGGKAKNDQSDSEKIALVLRGGMLPQASGSPARMRAPRDRLRRRPHLRRKRAERCGHGQKTHSQYNVPELGQKIASKATRDGVAKRFADASVHTTLEGALALITDDDALLTALALSILKTARPHAPPPLDLRQTVPGIGKMLSLVLLDDIPHLDRFPRVPDFAAYGRLGTCRQAAGGKRLGTSGKQIGNAPLTGACSEAATLVWRHTPQAQKLLARVEQQHDPGNALSILAHTLGRTVSLMLKRKGACAMNLFLRSAGRRAGEPGASLDSSGDEPAGSTR